MSNNTSGQKVRIPNLPTGAIVDKDGMPTDDELFFRQNLITALQKLMGDEGLVIPSQTTSDISTIVANQSYILSGDTVVGSYTCEPGTLLYDSTVVDPTQAVKVTINVAGVPTLKTIVLA